MKNKGIQAHRLSREPLEKLFAENWERQNTSRVTGKVDGNTFVAGELDGKGTLDYILAKDPNNPCGEVSDRDREVAATVIQWLGSLVGQHFIRDSLKSDTLIGKTEVLSSVSAILTTLREPIRFQRTKVKHLQLLVDEIRNQLLRLQRILSQSPDEYFSEKSW